MAKIEDLDYDPETGCLWWNKSGHGIKKGHIAGSIMKSGYIQIMIDGKQMLAHRVIFYIMTGRWPSETDHINRVRSDNRWSNLREVSRSENQKNKNEFLCKPYNKLGIKGVHQRPSGKFQLSGRNSKYIGQVDTLLEAKEWSDKYWKEVQINV